MSIKSRDEAISEIRDCELICRKCKSKDLLFDGVVEIADGDRRDHVSCNNCGTVSYIGWEVTYCCMIPKDDSELDPWTDLQGIPRPDLDNIGNAKR